MTSAASLFAVRRLSHNTTTMLSEPVLKNNSIRWCPQRLRHYALSLFLSTALIWCAPFASLADQPRPGPHQLLVSVMDETSLAVASARVTLTHLETHTVIRGESDYAGRCAFAQLAAGMYQLRVEKEGFYAVVVNDVRVGETQSLQVVLNHQQEFVERMDVIYSPPVIDPAKTATSESLSSREIVNLPYPTTRDIRNALPLIPGVLRDATGQFHISGSATSQTFIELDGFNIAQPVSGLFDLRISTDALRSVEVQSSRSSAEYGKGSGGVVSLVTGMGDDRVRFSATDFIPSFQNRKGWHINNWTPRATLSGPLRTKKAWFYEAADGEYDLTIVSELPPGADRAHSWRVSNLAKAQVNLTSAHVLTTSLLLNRSRAEHAGLSRFTPLEATLDRRYTAYLFTMKDQSSFSNGLLLDIGFAANQYRTDDRAQGRQSFVISPQGARGNFFKTSTSTARRLQWIAKLFLPSREWHGRHEFKIGADFDRIAYDQFVERRPMTVLREDGTLSRRINFFGEPTFGRNNFEASGYAQDRWSLADRLMVELGLRFDWDGIIRQPLFSPRLASSSLLTRDGETKLTLGVGLFYDATNLDQITRPLNGRREDVFFNRDGQTPTGPPIETFFQVAERGLKAPRALNWSVGLERKLPAAMYLTVEVIGKRGSNGLAFIKLGSQPKSPFVLGNDRRDRFHSVHVSLRRTFKETYELLASYTRSSARSNAVLDFNLDDPVFAQQAGGPLAWDAPNRFLSWGWLPLVRGFDLAYSLEWRDGYPFSVVNQDQRLIGLPNSRRFPDYFSLNAHVERRFRLFGFQWALRAGVNNLTGRDNATVVNNNLDSPQFLTFGGIQHRTFTGRIRFLGRK